MEKRTIEALSLLKEALLSDPRILLLNELEEEVANNEEVKELAKRKDEKSEEYEAAKTRFGDNSDMTKNAQKALYEAKLALDSHPLCKRYNEAYAEVADLYRQIDDILFGFVRTKKNCGGKQ